MAKSLLGFDIGTGALKIALCDGNLVRRAITEPLPDNLVREGRIISFEAMADFIKETMRKHKMPGKHCAVVLPSGLAFLRRIITPAMSVEQLEINLPYEFRDYLTMAKEKYFYDYSVNNMRQDEEGKPIEMDLTAAAVPKETIEEYKDMFRRAGLKLLAAAPLECAYSNVIHRHEVEQQVEGSREYCIIDLGHAASRIHIYSNERFEATRVIEYGSGTVDLAIAEALNVDEHVARSYKEVNHNGVHALEGPMSVYGTIAVEIMKAINFYGFNNPGSQLADAYYCGGGAWIEPLVQAIGQSISLNMHSIEELMPPSDKGLGSVPDFAAAVGITLQ